MLWTAIVAIVGVWIAALLFSFTLGGWIHLLPCVAAPLLVARLTQVDPEAEAFLRWKQREQKRTRRGRR